VARVLAPWEKALQQRSLGMNARYQLPKPPTTAATGATTGPTAGPPGSGGFLGPPPNVTIPGYDPDYSALLAGDPNVIAAAGDLGEFEGQLGDARRAAIRRAVIAAGLTPGKALADVDEGTILAAQQNQFSGAKELSRQRERSSGDLAAALGARGMTFSGAQVGGEQRIQEGYERGTTQLVQSLLDAISGYETQYASKLADVRTQYRQLREQAAYRIQQDPRYQPMGENDAVLDPISGLYMTPDGRWYQRNADGSTTRVGAPAAPSTAGAIPPSSVEGGLQAAVDNGMTVEDWAAIARSHPDYYESDNRMQQEALAAGRNFF
jgi:hypothetical protein